MQPKQGGRHFESLVILRFIHTADKFEFEKNFSIYRKNNPSCTISTSRCTPQRSPADRDLPNINDIKTQFGMLYNSKITATKTTHPTVLFKALWVSGPLEWDHILYLWPSNRPIQGPRFHPENGKPNHKETCPLWPCLQQGLWTQNLYQRQLKTRRNFFKKRVDFKT